MLAVRSRFFLLFSFLLHFLIVLFPRFCLQKKNDYKTHHLKEIMSFIVKNDYKHKKEKSEKSSGNASKNKAFNLKKLGLFFFDTESQNLNTNFYRGKEFNSEFLNTAEFKYHSYFQRIRKQLEKSWVPILKRELFLYYESGRKLANKKDYITQLLVVLNKEGEIVRVQLVSESGTSNLDDAAIKAFKKAGPFPNPPKGMINTNNEITIPWDFMLKT